jgi:aldehyde dehydrogenase (NAD+)
MSDTPLGQLYIDGDFRPSENDRYFDVVDPYDESLVGRAAEATIGDVGAAVGAARRAFDETSWATDRELRAYCLEQLQAGLRKEVEHLKQMQVAEAGTASVVLGSIGHEVENIGHLIDRIREFEWEQGGFPPAARFGISSMRTVHHEPYGVVGAITPWNVPITSNLWKTVPALAAGNTVVLKPAPETPLCAWLLARVVDEHTDIPAGVFNVISSSDNAVGGDGLTGDPRVDFFHFTGSTAVGQRVAERAAKGIRKVVLELGGKSANIILEDADLDSAIPHSVLLCMLNSGQGCILPTRMVVPASIYDDVVERAAAAVADVRMGNPRDPKTVVGPIIRASQVDRMAGLVERAARAGARVRAGGKRGDMGGKGFWYQPTLVADVDEMSEIAQTEVFGPVLSIIKYDGSEKEAVRIANATAYGLCSYIQSTDAERARRLAGQMRAGAVNIGKSLHTSWDTPTGGYGQSGLGRENGIQGWLEFLQTKTIATPVLLASARTSCRSARSRSTLLSMPTPSWRLMPSSPAATPACGNGTAPTSGPTASGVSRWVAIWYEQETGSRLSMLATAPITTGASALVAACSPAWRRSVSAPATSPT